MRVLAIEILTSARGIEMRGEGASPTSQRVIDVLRTRVPGAGPDRYLAPDITAAVELVRSGELLRRSIHHVSIKEAIMTGAYRGTQLHTLGWPQEAALRMLQNNLDPEVAEHPEELIVYGGTGKAARN